MFYEPSQLYMRLFSPQHMSYRGVRTHDRFVTALWLVRTTVWGWPFPLSALRVTLFLESHPSHVCMESAETGITPYLAVKVSASYKHNWCFPASVVHVQKTNKPLLLLFYQDLNISSKSITLYNIKLYLSVMKFLLFDISVSFSPKIVGGKSKCMPTNTWESHTCCFLISWLK